MMSGSRQATPGGAGVSPPQPRIASPAPPAAAAPGPERRTVRLELSSLHYEDEPRHLNRRFRPPRRIRPAAAPSLGGHSHSHGESVTVKPPPRCPAVTSRLYAIDWMHFHEYLFGPGLDPCPMPAPTPSFVPGGGARVVTVVWPGPLLQGWLTDPPGDPTFSSCPAAGRDTFQRRLSQSEPTSSSPSRAGPPAPPPEYSLLLHSCPPSPSICQCCAAGSQPIARPLRPCSLLGDSGGVGPE
jgi:hypothetical protein